MNVLLVGLGGAVGSMARYGTSLAAARIFGSPIPYSTAIVNIVGCFVIGVLTGLGVSEPARFSTESRALLFTGVLGGFTTFSAFGLDTVTLVANGRGTLAILNVLLQVGVGLGAALVGYNLAK